MHAGTIDPAPMVIGHRGAAGSAPENTIAGIEAAARLGVAWVEFDVKLTRDNQTVLFHDDRLQRTTDGRGAFAANDFASLRRLDAGSWFAPAFGGERVPTLDEALEALATYNLGANVEIKPSPGRERATAYAVARSLHRHWPEHLPQPLLSSFSAAALAVARDVAPGVPRALLVHRRPRDWLAQARRLDCVALHANQRHMTPDWARTALTVGLALRCFTVNDPRRAARLLAWGVESIITDHPERLLG